MKHVGMLIAVIVLASIPQISRGHCQIPCGIYGDDTRFAELQEHVATVRKSIVKIKELSTGKDQNQLVRWILNKDVHADKISEIAHKYFLAQRIKETSENYVEKLKALHKIIVYSMKTKQSLDESNVDKLDEAIKAFRKLYNKK